MIRRFVPAIVFGGTTAFLAAPVVIRAQTAPTAPPALEEITVTAERRVESLEKAPLSVSVRSGVDLSAQGKYSLESILEDIPGISGGAAAATPTLPGATAVGTDAPSSGMIIRGIPSSNSAGGSAISTAPAVATYVDGIYEGVGGNYDISRVEVLRGPQGTLYGRSATAGVVAIHTPDPNLSELTGDFGGELGDYNLSRGYGALSVPLVKDQLAIRLAGNRYEVNGFDNGSGGRSINSDAKAKILWKPRDDFSMLVGAALQHTDANSGGRQITRSSDPYAIDYQVISVKPSWNETRQVWAEMNWDAGIGRLTYIPALRAFTQNGIASLVAQGNEVNTATRTPQDSFMTHEVRLASNADGKLVWQVGSLYYDNRLKNHTDNILPNVPFPGANLVTFISDTRKHVMEAGFFGQATYSLTDYLRATAGLRYDYTKVDIQQNYTSIAGITNSIPDDEQLHTFNNLTYQARLEADLSKQSILYVSASTGFSPGDVGLQADAAGVPRAVVLAAETLHAYEIGNKNVLFGGQLQVNASIFYNYYGGYQNTISVSVSEFHSYNVPLQNYGADLEILYRPTLSDRFGVTLGYVDDRFVKKPADFVADYAVDYPTGVVPLKANISYSHEFVLPNNSSLVLRGDGNYLSSRYAASTGFPAAVAALGGTQYIRTGSAVFGNLGATWATPDRSLNINAYVRNVSNNRYRTSMNVLAADLTGVILPTASWQYQPAIAEPRTYGVSVGYHF
jgi:outer membrane receptor protein involved in Fe transport